MKLLRLPRAKVVVGVPLPWNVRDADCNLLLTRGHVVDSEDQLERLLSRGAFVDVEEAKAALLICQPPAETVRPKQPDSLIDMWAKSADGLRRVIVNPRDTPQWLVNLTAFASGLIILVDKDVDIALYHTVRQETADPFLYGYHHAIHSAVLSLLMARRLQWPQARVLSLVNAALTMNMAIFELQGQLASQDGPLRDSQTAQIRAHPEQATEWLARAGVVDADRLIAVSQHHEHLDGSGYPRGTCDIADIATTLHVIDVFMAKISARKVRQALTVQEAAKQLFREDNGGPTSSAIIKEFGIYPPGEVVGLANGEIAVVVRRTQSVKCPIVASLTDCTGKRTVHTTRRDTSQPAVAITGTVQDKSLVARMPPERVYGFATGE